MYKGNWDYLKKIHVKPDILVCLEDFPDVTYKNNALSTFLPFFNEKGGNLQSRLLPGISLKASNLLNMGNMNKEQNFVHTKSKDYTNCYALPVDKAKYSVVEIIGRFDTYSDYYVSYSDDFDLIFFKDVDDFVSDVTIVTAVSGIDEYTNTIYVDIVSHKCCQPCAREGHTNPPTGSRFELMGIRMEYNLNTGDKCYIYKDYDGIRSRGVLEDVFTLDKYQERRFAHGDGFHLACTLAYEFLERI